MIYLALDGNEIASASRVAPLDIEVPDHFFNTYPAYCFEYNGTELALKEGADSLRDTTEKAKEDGAAALLLEEQLKVATLDARTRRNTLLASTDFYALSDVVMTTEMTAYRQELRAVPNQVDFPNTIIWPTAP